MKTLQALIKDHYTPKKYENGDNYFPFVIPWKGGLLYTTRAEAMQLRKNRMIFSCYGVADFTPEERLKVKIEAMQWHFDEIGAPVIVRKSRETKGTWIITCPTWQCSYPTKRPLQELKSLFDEITSCIDPANGEIDFPLNHD